MFALFALFVHGLVGLDVIGHGGLFVVDGMRVRRAWRVEGRDKQLALTKKREQEREKESCSSLQTL